MFDSTLNQELAANNTDKALRPKELAGIPSFRLDNSQGELKLIEGVGQERHVWYQSLIKSQVNSLVLPEDIANKLHQFGKSFFEEVAGYLLGIFQNGTFYAVGFDMIAYGQESEVALFDPRTTPPFYRCLRDFYLESVKAQVPSFCTMLFHNHPSQLSNDPDSQEIERQLANQLSNGSLDFLKEYIAIPTVEAAYDWSSNSELSSADLRVRTSAQVLIRSSTRLITLPCDRLNCFDTYRLPKNAQGQVLKEITISIVESLAGGTGFNGGNLIQDLETITRAGSDLLKLQSQLFGSTLYIYGVMRNNNLATLLAESYDSLSPACQKRVQRAIELTYLEYDALKLPRGALPPFFTGEWEMHNEPATPFHLTDGAYFPVSVRSQKNFATLLKKMETPSTHDLSTNRGPTLQKAWTRNHKILSEALKSIDVPILGIAGMLDSHLENYRTDGYVRYNQLWFTSALDGDGIKQLYQLYNIAHAAYSRTGSTMHNAGPAGGIVVCLPVVSRERILATAERYDLNHFTLTNDSAELRKNSRDRGLNPLQTFATELDTENPLAVVDIEELLPIYSGYFIQSTRVDCMMVEIISSRLIIQKIVARIIDQISEKNIS